MVRRALALGLILGLHDPSSCGGVESPTSGVNAPCTRDKDCSAGLVCASGVCTQPDAPPPTPDAGGDSGDADHGG